MNDISQSSARDTISVRIPQTCSLMLCYSYDVYSTLMRSMVYKQSWRNLQFSERVFPNSNFIPTTMRLHSAAFAALLFVAVAHASLGDRLPAFKECVKVCASYPVLCPFARKPPSDIHPRTASRSIAALTAHQYVCDWAHGYLLPRKPS